MKLSVIATVNAQDIIGELTRQIIANIPAEVDDYEIIFVEDFSLDDTKRKLLKFVKITSVLKASFFQ